ncbi:LysM peptidoglycan-binding domain-containing protein [Leptospira fletcheri]|uniref:LysM peptidoglycan-binding domain-containing protein n=1 Tax=Leptospira fletcheri TaxID=2484981 RepID=A0A4R9GIP0_9LEPT|nr:LysM peptidoglycan-binding domain-containing M23 family metallopeptidase [Leptospira fletcheri]TGK12879.1 LysM peptidoglycan-binding domain-containing protein [Leptospira fletcheri]
MRIRFRLGSILLFCIWAFTSDARTSRAGTVPSRTHKVQNKETAFSIAKKHGLDWRLLLEWNGKKESDGLRTGEVLRLPPDPSKGSGRSSAGTEFAVKQSQPRFGKPLGKLPPIALPFSTTSHYPNKGVLFKVGRHKEVRPVTEGKVVMVDRMEGYRKYIILEHKGGFSSVYANLRAVSVKEGEIVGRNSSMGELESGRGLYLQINQGNKALDPMSVIVR